MLLNDTIHEIVVSVVIPSYNHRNYIAAAIESVFNQDVTRTLYELIIVDDGSSDGSVDLLYTLQAKYDFKLIVQQNKGVSAALNRGISASVGKYVALLASDDLWAPDKLRAQIEALRGNPKSRLCFTNGYVFGAKTKKVYKPIVFSGNVRAIIPILNFVPSSSLFFERYLYEQVGGFSENVALEDWDFLIKAAGFTEFTCVNKPLIRYRVHDASTMKRLRKSNAMVEKKLQVLNKNRALISWPIFAFSMLLHQSYEKLGRFFHR